MVKFRIDEQTSRRLRLCSEELNVSKSEIIRRGIDRIYDDLNDK